MERSCAGENELGPTKYALLLTVKMQVYTFEQKRDPENDSFQHRINGTLSNHGRMSSEVTGKLQT